MFSHTVSWGRIACMVAVAIIAITAGVPTSIAQVAPKDSDVPSITVRYADLNISTEQGSRVLYHRLELAAERVCPRIGYATELQRNRDARLCIAASVDRAVKQIKSAQLAQLAASKMR